VSTKVVRPARIDAPIAAISENVPDAGLDATTGTAPPSDATYSRARGSATTSIDRMTPPARAASARTNSA